jgi:antitoxin component of MazEF toxin-antitoxin module
MKKPKNERKLTKVAGHSWAVILPPDFVKELGWRERQRLVIKRVARGILIRDAFSKKRKK